MKEYKLYPKEGERDKFLDFLKGLAILGVIWLHCMPLQDRMVAPLWCGMSVSLFLLIQVFHAYRKGAVNSRWPDVWKLFKRIVFPMLAVTAILALIQSLFGMVHHAGGFVNMLQDGGYGPGSYYPWIYLQFAIILPLVGRLQKYLKPGVWGGVILLFSIALEFVSSLAGMPDWLWRLLFFRYALLIWLGYDVVKNGIRLTPILIALSLASMAFIVVMYYKNPDISPILIHNGWKVEHWPAFFYPAFLLLWLIRCIYEKLSALVKDIIGRIGVASYEIFLCQMLYFAIAEPSLAQLFRNEKLNYITYLLFAWCFSVGVGMLWNRIKQKIYDRKINHKIA